MSVICFRMCISLFSNVGFDIVVFVDFDLSLPVGDKFLQSDDSGSIISYWA